MLQDSLFRLPPGYIPPSTRAPAAPVTAGEFPARPSSVRLASQANVAASTQSGSMPIAAVLATVAGANCCCQSPIRWAVVAAATANINFRYVERTALNRPRDTGAGEFNQCGLNILRRDFVESARWLSSQARLNSSLPVLRGPTFLKIGVGQKLLQQHLIDLSACRPLRRCGHRIPAMAA